MVCTAQLDDCDFRLYGVNRLRRSDCFVSLRRSEGLGLQPAESVWLGTPVLAMRYGGNLDR